jgi:hypothetical protein
MRNVILCAATGELHEHPVASGLNGAAIVLCDAGIDDLAPQSLQRCEDADLVQPMSESLRTQK